MALDKNDAAMAVLLNLIGSPSSQSITATDPALAKQIAAALEKVTKSTYTALRGDHDSTYDNTPKGPTKP